MLTIHPRSILVLTEVTAKKGTGYDWGYFMMWTPLGLCEELVAFPGGNKHLRVPL